MTGCPLVKQQLLWQNYTTADWGSKSCWQIACDSAKAGGLMTAGGIRRNDGP
jgi:hypothetical protein